MQKILSYCSSSLVIFLIVCSAFSKEEEPILKYDFWKNKQDMTIRACLSGYNSKEVSWLVPVFFQANNYHKSLEVVTDTKKEIVPKYDYIQTNYKDTTCITYTFDNYKGWYDKYFQDVSKDAFFIFGYYNSLIVPDSIFKDHETINVQFNWNKFSQPVSSNFSQASNNIKATLTLQDLDAIYFFQGYSTSYLDVKKQNKFIYPRDYQLLITKTKPQLGKVNAYLEKHFPATDIKLNTFIFGEHRIPVKGNPGFGYFNDREFIQVVGLEDKQIFSKAFIRTFVHEYVHKLIGCTVKFKVEKYPDEYWFKEGFTDYVTSEILLDTKIWNIRDYMDFYNNQIYRYFALNMHKHKLRDLQNKPLYAEAGYMAGMFYASKLNYFIITNTNGDKDLIKFLSMFVDKFVKDKNLHFSEKLFFSSLESFVKKPFPTIEELRESKNLLSEELVAGKLRLKNQKMQLPVYSVDFYELFSTMKLNNKAVVNIYFKDNKLSQLNLELRDKNNNIEPMVLKPTYVTKSIPQYEMVR